MIAHSMNIF